MLVRLFVCLLVSLNQVGILMLFCRKLSAASASLAVKEFCKSVNVGQKYKQTHCLKRTVYRPTFLLLARYVPNVAKRSI